MFKQKKDSLKICPKCKKKTKFSRMTSKKCYACQFCGYQYSPLAGTIFHKSETSLKHWFYAIFLFSTSKNGVSAMELKRQLGVTYKTAWRMAKQIRSLFKQGKNPLENNVEVDETYVGGKREGKRGRGAEGKTPVVGAVERGGEVRASVTPNTQSSKVMLFIRDNVDIKATVHTDEYGVYNPLKEWGYQHKRVNHGSGKYVRGVAHTNTIEGFWSQLKRSIHGTYHAVSPKHLQNYVDEFAYRYNRRHFDVAASFSSILSRAGRPA